MLKYLPVCVSIRRKCQNKREKKKKKKKTEKKKRKKKKKTTDPQNRQSNCIYANVFCKQCTNILSCQQTCIDYILLWPSGKFFKTSKHMITGICSAELQNIFRKFSFIIFNIKLTYLHTKQNIHIEVFSCQDNRQRAHLVVAILDIFHSPPMLKSMASVSNTNVPDGFIRPKK